VYSVVVGILNVSEGECRSGVRREEEKQAEAGLYGRG
jgi:hypothetical protein